MDLNEIVLFAIGLAIGSFLNVVALRYTPEEGIFKFARLTGRSHCPQCKKQLKWYELIPLISFILQHGKCRSCKTKLSYQYPLVELFSGLAFVLIPQLIFNSYQFEIRQLGEVLPTWFYLFSALSILFALILILIAAIDFRLKIIPDEANIIIVILGIGAIIVQQSAELFTSSTGSFIGHYAVLFGLRDNIWINHLAAGIFGLLFFGVIIMASRGRAMGMGDMKLAGTAGIFLGFPDIILAVLLSFIVGAFVSILLIIRRKENLKSLIPFGPFIVIGIFLTMFYGVSILGGYFSLFGG